MPWQRLLSARCPSRVEAPLGWHGWPPSPLHTLDQLRAAVNQDIFVPNGGHTQNVRRDSNGVAVVRVCSDVTVRILGKGKMAGVPYYAGHWSGLVLTAVYDDVVFADQLGIFVGL